MLFQALLIAAIFHSAEGSLYYAPKQLESRQTIETILHYTFEDFDCVEVFLDGSRFSRLVLSLILSTHRGPYLQSSLLSRPSKSCVGHAYVVRRLHVALLNFTKDYSHRNLVISEWGSREGADLMGQKNMAAGYAEGILAQFKPKFQVIQKEILDDEMHDSQFTGAPWKRASGGVRDFKGKVIKVAADNCTVYVNNRMTKNGTLEWIGGIDLKLLRIISSKLNFTLQMEASQGTGGRRWGRLVGDSWIGGILGNVRNGQAEVGACGVWATWHLKRTGLVPSVSSRNTLVRLLVPRSPRRGGYWFQVFSPFRLELWAVLVLFVMVTAAGLSIAARIAVNQNDKRYTSLAYSLMTMYGILVLGSVPSLVSHLTTEFYPETVTSVKDLVKKGYILITDTDMDSPTFFNHLDKWHIRLNRRMVNMDSEAEINKMLKLGGQKYTVLGQELVPGKMISLSVDGIEGWVAVPTVMASYYAGFVYPPGSGLAPAMDHVLHTLYDTGITSVQMGLELEAVYLKMPHMRDLASHDRTTFLPNPAALKISCLRGPIILLEVGIVLSCVTFAAEIAYHAIITRTKN